MTAYRRVVREVREVRGPDAVADYETHRRAVASAELALGRTRALAADALRMTSDARVLLAEFDGLFQALATLKARLLDPR